MLQPEAPDVTFGYILISVEGQSNSKQI